MCHARFFCCLLIFACGRPLLAAEAPLVWKFNVGDEHHYQLTQNMNMKIVLGAADRQIETKTQQVLDLTWKIEHVDEQGVAKMVQTVDRVQMDLQAPGQQEVHYDTDSDEPPSAFAAMLDPLFKVLLQEPLPVTISPRGEIQNMEIPETLSKAISGIPSAEMMGEMFRGEGFKKMVQNTSLVLPEASDLTPGHEWTRKGKLKNPQFGEIATKMTYRYLGPREVKGEPLEAFHVEIKMDFSEAPDGVRLEVESHESSGEILFSRESGYLHSSTLQQEMLMNLATAGQGSTQNLVLNMTLERIAKNTEKNVEKKAESTPAQ